MAVTDPRPAGRPPRQLRTPAPLTAAQRDARSRAREDVANAALAFVTWREVGQSTEDGGLRHLAQCREREEYRRLRDAAERVVTATNPQEGTPTP